ncbi:hypothetical protein ACH61_02677 [Rathayibacter tanaceti]|uniref:Uncharacterized protein n=1 Tax=Rathayibacter tanaceti TaxID=1671680 RepID=A0A162F7U0_9MICO|nr:hypothetical protein ACH61_02677 [Rathayibacter tanaceti]
MTGVGSGAGATPTLWSRTAVSASARVSTAISAASSACSGTSAIRTSTVGWALESRASK